jgi:hypothetical protein
MAAQAGTELFSIQLNGAICYENRLAFPVSLLPLKHFTVRQVEQQNLQNKTISLWRESWNNIGETKSVGNKLYYNKITTQIEKNWFV